MKKSLIIAGLGALLATSVYSSAQADPQQGNDRWPQWYVGLTGGYTYMSDQDVSSATATQISGHDGYGFGGSIGYLPSSSMPLLNSLRFEGEVTYHANDIKSVTRTNGSTATGTGRYSSTAYMVNSFYDFPTGGQWSPYIGAGLGVAEVHLPTSTAIGNTGSTSDEFAYQGLIGIGYTPVTIPDTQWTLGYRYLATSDPSFAGATTKYSTNSVEVGAKFRF